MKHLKSQIQKFIGVALVAVMIVSCQAGRQAYSTRHHVPQVEEHQCQTAIQYVPTMPAGVAVNSRHATCNTAPIYQPESWQGQLQSKLDQHLTATLLDSTQVTLAVFDLTDDKWLYCLNAQQRMRPASCMKLVTAIAALDILGPDYRYQPTVLRPGWGWCWDDDESGFTATAQKKWFSPDILWQEKREWTLAEVLQPMMKKSDNMMAESVFWQLAERRASATRKECAAQVKNVISKTGLNPNHYTIADGSGLSLYDYVTSELLVSLLRYAYSNNAIFEQLYPALPIAGEDGTLAKRMIDTPAHRNVHAKTGTVTGISSLSGYCTAANGHQLCFSIINAGVESSSLGRAFQNKVCQTLCE